MMAVWVNGRLVEDSRAAIPVRDRGFTLGDGLFETMRAYGGRIFRLRDHLERLERGARRIGLPLPEGLFEGAVETLEATGLKDAAVRLTVTRGEGEGLTPPVGVPATAVITARPYRAFPGWYERGVRAVTARGRLDENRATAGLKHLGYLEAILAVREARAAGCDDALFVDGAGHLAEAAASNLFMVLDGVLATPPLSCGILPGVTRAAVVEIAAAGGVPVREEPVAPADLDEATEAFLTSSLREIVPLVVANGRPVGGGAPGVLTRRLLRAYRDLTRSGSREGVAR